MSRRLHPATFTVLSILLCAASASAETLRCQSVNGNLNCAGSGGVSCQTVNGKTTCVSGHGDVVQSFGGGSRGDDATHDENAGNEGKDDSLSGPVPTQRLEQRGPNGRTLLLQRQGSMLHFRSDWLSIDRD